MTVIVEAAPIASPPRPATGPLPARAPADQIVRWTDDEAARMGLPVEDVPVTSVGGGIGSFITVDYLRIAGGLSVDDIRVVSNLDHPWQTYEHLTRVSQIPRHERIRSDSSSRPDNLWGYPSYALQEALDTKSLRPLLHVLIEPFVAGYYTPQLGRVLEGVKREATRIRYSEMLVRGVGTLVRHRVGGGYFVVVAGDPTGPPTRLLRCRDVHLALGYSGLAFQPELQRLRLEHGDHWNLVNAYEDHEHLYARFRKTPGTIVVRGGGIVASRILERLVNERREHGAQIQIVHVLRTFVEGPHGPHPWARRPGADGFAYQGFNYPKSAWGGQLRAAMAHADEQRRRELYEQIGGTTTARRPKWRRQLRQARAAGWYHARPGVIEDVVRLDDERLRLRVAGTSSTTEITADAVIDCTGLDPNVRGHRILADLIDRGGAGLNVLGRMDVEPSFELRGARSGMGRVYVTGAAALGGYFPGVDTFLGLQLSAQDLVDDVARRGHCLPLTPTRSIRHWLRWMRGRSI